MEPNQTQEVAKSNYGLDLVIEINVKTKNGKQDVQLQSDLNTPFTLILFALNNLTDSLNAVAKTRTPEQLLRMTLKDIMVQQSQEKQNEQDAGPVQGK